MSFLSVTIALKNDSKFFSVIYDKIKLREKIETEEILGHWPGYVNFT